MSRIFVTGSAGMIGTNVTAELLASGHRLVGVDNFWRGKQKNVKRFLSHRNFEFRNVDIAESIEWSKDMTSDDIVIHIADIVAGIGYVFSKEYSVFRQNNRINSQVSSIIAERRPSKVIYLGTACSYPQEMQRDVSTSVLREVDKFPAHPESGYGWSKLIGELELQLAVKGSSTKLCVLDLHNVYGAPCVYDDETSQVIPSLINRSIESESGVLGVWGTGDQGRAFLHVSDVANAVVRALKYDGPVSSFMIGPDYCTTIREVAEIIISHPKIAVDKISFDTDKPTGDIGRFADYALAREELGWQPTVEIKEGIFDLIEYILRDKGLPE